MSAPREDEAIPFNFTVAVPSRESRRSRRRRPHTQVPGRRSTHSRDSATSGSELSRSGPLRRRFGPSGPRELRRRYQAQGVDPYLAAQREGGQEEGGGDDDAEWHVLEAARQRMWSQSGPAWGGTHSAADMSLAEGLASLRSPAYGVPQSAEALYTQARARTDELWAREPAVTRGGKRRTSQLPRPASRVEQDKGEMEEEEEGQGSGAGDRAAKSGRHNARSRSRGQPRKEAVSRDVAAREEAAKKRVEGLSALRIEVDSVHGRVASTVGAFEDGLKAANEAHGLPSSSGPRLEGGVPVSRREVVMSASLGSIWYSRNRRAQRARKAMESLLTDFATLGLTKLQLLEKLRDWFMGLQVRVDAMDGEFTLDNDSVNKLEQAQSSDEEDEDEEPDNEVEALLRLAKNTREWPTDLLTMVIDDATTAIRQEEYSRAEKALSQSDGMLASGRNVEQSFQRAAVEIETLRAKLTRAARKRKKERADGLARVAAARRDAAEAESSVEKYRAQVRDRDAELAKANEEVDKRVRETSHEYETLIADLEFRHKRAVREAVQRAAMQDDTELDGLHEERERTDMGLEEYRQRYVEERQRRLIDTERLEDELSEAHEELGRAEALRDGELSELRAQHETHVDKIKAEAAHASEEAVHTAVAEANQEREALQESVKALAAEAEAAREEGKRAGREEGEKAAAEWRSRMEAAEERAQALQEELTYTRHRAEAAAATAPAPEELEEAHRRVAQLEGELQQAKEGTDASSAAADEVAQLKNQLRQANAEAANARKQVVALEQARQTARTPSPAQEPSESGGQGAVAAAEAELERERAAGKRMERQLAQAKERAKELAEEAERSRNDAREARREWRELKEKMLEGGGAEASGASAPPGPSALEQELEGEVARLQEQLQQQQAKLDSEGDGLDNVRSSALDLRSLLAEDIEDEGPVPLAGGGGGGGGGATAATAPVSAASVGDVDLDNEEDDGTAVPVAVGDSALTEPARAPSGDVGEADKQEEKEEEEEEGVASAGDQRAREAEQRAAAAEDRAQAAEARLREVELQASEAGERLAAAEGRARAAEQRAESASAAAAEAKEEEEAVRPQRVEKQEEEEEDEDEDGKAVIASEAEPTVSDAGTQTGPYTDEAANQRAQEATDRAERAEGRAETAEHRVAEISRQRDQLQARTHQLEDQLTAASSQHATSRPGSVQGGREATPEPPADEETDGLPMAFEPCRNARAQLAHLIQQLSAQERQLTRRFEQARQDEAEEAARQAERVEEEAAEIDALRDQLARLHTSQRRSKGLIGALRLQLAVVRTEKGRAQETEVQLRAEARRFREELQAAHEETEVLEREHAIAKSELQALREQASRDTPPGSPAPTLSQTPSRLDASPQNRVRRLQRRASFVESDSMEQQLAGLSAEERADVLARSVQALHRKLDLQNEAWRVKLRGAERQAIQATAELRVKQLEAADSVAAAQRLHSRLEEAAAECKRAEQRAERAEQGIVAQGIAGDPNASLSGTAGSGGKPGTAGTAGSGVVDRARVEKALTDMLQRSGGAALRLAVSRLHLHFAGLDAQLRALIDAVACADGSGGGGGVSGKGRSVLSSLPSLPSLPPQLLHEGLLRQYAQPDRAWQALVEAGGGASPPQAPHAAVLSVDATRPQPTRAPSRRRGSSARSARAASATVGDVVDASEGGIMLEAALQATSRAAPSSELDRTDNGSAPLAENAGALTLALLSRYAAHAGALVRALILQEQELTRVRAAAAAEGKREGAGDVQALCTRLRGQLTAARARERDLQQQLAAANERAAVAAASKGPRSVDASALADTEAVPAWLEGSSGALEAAESLLHADSTVRRRRAQASRALFEATQQARRARHTLETDPPDAPEELERLQGVLSAATSRAQRATQQVSALEDDHARVTAWLGQVARRVRGLFSALEGRPSLAATDVNTIAAEGGGETDAQQAGLAAAAAAQERVSNLRRALGVEGATAAVPHTAPRRPEEALHVSRVGEGGRHGSLPSLGQGTRLSSRTTSRASSRGKRGGVRQEAGRPTSSQGSPLPDLRTGTPQPGGWSSPRTDEGRALSLEGRAAGRRE